MEDGGYKIVDQNATYFLTFTVVGWIDLFTRKECKQIIIDSLKYCQQQKGLMIYAYVLMESHIHLVASAQEKSSGISAIIRDFKKFTSKQIIQWMQNNTVESRKEWMEMVFRYYGKYNANNAVFQVWKQDNCPKICALPEFTFQKINYIHQNPVVSGIVDDPVAYIYSSARNYAGISDTVLEVIVLDHTSYIGYVPG